MWNCACDNDKEKEETGLQTNKISKKKLIREVSLGICNGYKHKPISVNVSKNGLRLESDSMESVVSVMEETNVYVILYIY